MPERKPGARSIPSLDGLRAISILLVILSHASMSAGPAISVPVHRLVDWGVVGVRVFFVISGYLITRLLLGELARTDAISLPRFYFRRTLRIFPPFYLYLLVLGLVAALGWVEQSGRGIAVASLYAANYEHAGWFAAHAWSLAVEEQFYLIWPAVLLMVGPRRGWTVPLLMVAACPLLRLYAFEQSNHTGLPDHHFDLTADLLAVGCLGAFWEQPFVRLLRRLGILGGSSSVTAGAMAGCVAVLLFASSLSDHPRADLLLGRSVAVGAVCVLMLLVIHAPTSGLGRVLNWGPAAALGRISYSLYLWQQLFLSPPTVRGLGLPLWAALPLALGAALLSYHLVEQPILAHRERIGRALRAWAPGARRLPDGTAPADG